MQIINGVLEFWCLHIQTLSDQERVRFQRARPGCIPAVITGRVVRDLNRRWEPGSAMRSSLVVNFSIQDMLVRTQNSVYQLTGPGEILYRGIPADYSLAVGETILRVGGIKNF